MLALPLPWQEKSVQNRLIMKVLNYQDLEENYGGSKVWSKRRIPFRQLPAYGIEPEHVESVRSSLICQLVTGLYYV